MPPSPQVRRPLPSTNLRLPSPVPCPTAKVLQPTFPSLAVTRMHSRLLVPTSHSRHFVLSVGKCHHPSSH
ncbi:hypothetical protein E2C01_090167 [Portunus trituberculatus]|uniref:Uncharacterized protein n=1 Tax=Portunus trituberculatus TaxID=210409 RepID=A0A5B7JK69_PORTR|nr:hypothetical protein [Portunus trituberculatus]